MLECLIYISSKLNIYVLFFLLTRVKYIKFLNKSHFKIPLFLQHFQDKIPSILHSIQCPPWPFSAGLNPRTCPNEQFSFTELLEIPQTNHHFSSFAHAISFAINVENVGYYSLGWFHASRLGQHPQFEKTYMIKGESMKKGSESWVELCEIQNLTPSLGRMNLQTGAKFRDIRGKYRYAVREVKGKVFEKETIIFTHHL